MRQEELLINRLAAYARSDMYPFHMPGHKRRTGPEDFFMNSCVDSFTNPFAVDITEIEGFDNLHHPEGILRDSMKWEELRLKMWTGCLTGIWIHRPYLSYVRPMTELYPI